MEKDYQNWHQVKQRIDDKDKRPLFKQRDIWWYCLGANVGDEQNGKGKLFSRPVLVLKKFNKNVFLAAPLSTKVKDRPYYHKFKLKSEEQAVILSQIKLVDAKRLTTRIVRISENEFEEIKSKAKDYLFG
jgi:mRNA interferase MazF